MLLTHYRFSKLKNLCLNFKYYFVSDSLPKIKKMAL